MCDFEAGVCTHCRGTGVDIGTPEGEVPDGVRESERGDPGWGLSPHA